MIIENKGEFHINELLEYKHSIKCLDFKNISEIKNLNLLNEFKLLTELKLSTCFIENNKIDLSQTFINTLTISNCYFDLNDIVIPSHLTHLICRLSDIYDYKIYESLKKIVKIEYDSCQFKTSITEQDIDQLKTVEFISFTNCKGLSDIEFLLKKTNPIKIFLQNTDVRININKIHSAIDLEFESYENIKIKDNVLTIKGSII